MGLRVVVSAMPRALTTPDRWWVGLTRAGNTRHAFITGPDGMGMRDLDTLGGTGSSAIGINDAGQVVGDYFTAGDVSHAFITGANGMGMKDVGIAGGYYSTARGINDAGQVVGCLKAKVLPTLSLQALMGRVQETSALWARLV